jgi:hypothetical protein
VQDCSFTQKKPFSCPDKDTKTRSYIVLRPAVTSSYPHAMKTLYKTVLFLFVFISKTYASHLMGGEIRATYVSGQTYKISVHVYLDLVNAAGAANAMQTVQVCFGDGNTSEIPRVSTTRLTDFAASVAVFEKTYTYPSSGTFQISASINSRSSYINLPNSINENLFVWTVINTQTANNTPVLPYAAIAAGVKQVFSVDLAPAVQDQDSITVRLQFVSKPSPGTCGVRGLQTGYFYPNDLTKAGTFKIDSKNKRLVWNAPEAAGNYIYAFVVDEWRDGIIISQSYHEGTIIVTDRPGETVKIPDYEASGGLITAVPVTDSGSPEISMTLQAYPVPTDDFLTFKVYSKKRSIVKVQLINLQGAVVKELSSKIQVMNFQDEFDMRLLSKGLYLLRALNDVESVTQKIVR